MKLLLLLCFVFVHAVHARGQGVALALFRTDSLPGSTPFLPAGNPQLRTFMATSYLLDAALNSLNSLNSLIKKESYRNRITAFNNPASAELGFSLEAEIQAALQPILSKTRSTDAGKFSDVVASLVGNPLPGSSSGTPAGALFHTVVSLVGDLAVREKRVTRADVDSFLLVIGRYFGQYDKLESANQKFEDKIDRLNGRLLELQFDIREYALDMITVLRPAVLRSGLKERSLEELLLRYLDVPALDSLSASPTLAPYPGDGVKGAKDIASSIQKRFAEYQKIYNENYSEIKSILQGCRSLGKRINLQQVDRSLSEVEALYLESGQADLLNLRLSTLQGRLQALVQAEAALHTPAPR